MALRTIRQLGDEILTKKCREVKAMTPRLETLIDDMLETMYDAGGVGLAAPQVGVLRRIVVIDIYDGMEPLILVNPGILEEKGSQTADEGCLSYPGMAGKVTRPYYIRYRALNEDMEEIEGEAEGLLARAICHELDHLEGHMYVEKVEGEIHEVSYDEEEEEDEYEGSKENAPEESPENESKDMTKDEGGTPKEVEGESV